MCPLKPTQRVYDVIRDIEEGKYKLPSIQRLFVWKQEQVLKLFDSIMQGFPVGAIIIWLPPENSIRYKDFFTHYKTGDIVISHQPHDESSKPYMVLDGQQRLQSLYLGFYGSFDGSYLYLKIDELADENEPDYHYKFKFLPAENKNSDASYVQISRLMELEIEDIGEYVNGRLMGYSEDVRSTASRIISKFISSFKVQEPIHLQEMGSKFSYDDVLSVFERVNSGGTKLSKSDLLFSIVTSKIPDMEERFRGMVEDLNNGGRFDFNTDFIIKTAFIVFDKRAKYEFTKLRDKAFLDKLESRFEHLEEAITSLRDWLDGKALIRTGRFLPSQLALIPIIDFLIVNKKYKIGPMDGKETTDIRQYLYMAFFNNLFAYGADSVLDQIHEILVSASKAEPGVFPVQTIGEYMVKRKKIDSYCFKQEYLQNIGVILNILSGGVSELPKTRGWSLENDHIFPRAELSRRQIIFQVDDIGNFRLLPKLPNIIKRDSIPSPDIDFFGNKQPNLLSLFQSAREDLNQSTYSSFVDYRRKLIVDTVTEFLGLNNN